MMRRDSFLSSDERICNLFATVEGADEDEEGATGDDETEGAGCCVVLFVCEAEGEELVYAVWDCVWY